jgi:hypothetical protein
VTAVTGSTGGELERRYRETLEWYPAAWRAAHGEAMLGTLLDEAEATGRTRPTIAQELNLAWFGLSTRFARVGRALPAGVRDRAAAISLGAGFAYALVMFVGAEWAPWAPNGPWNGWASQWAVPVPGFGPFASAAAVLFALWIAAFAAAIAGFSRASSIILFWTIPTGLVIEAVNTRMTMLAPPSESIALLAALAVVAMLGRPTRPGQKVRGAVWLGGFAGVAAVAITVLAWPAFSAQGGWFPDAFIDRINPHGPWGSVVFHPGVTLSLLAALAVFAVAMRRPAWAGAAVVASLPWWIVVVATLANQAPTVLLGIAVAGPVLAILLATAVRRSGYRLVLERRD